MIAKVELENWKSHHETELDFSTGVNALIGTMGSGKSSVLEAITFALYGTTPALKSREVTLDDVIRRSPSKAEEARVKVWLKLDGEMYTVERNIVRDKGTKRSELRKDGELIEAPSTQEVTEQVEKLLGMDFDSFTRAVYSRQNQLDVFMEMTPGERKEKVDELLKLDRFEDARKTVVKVENRLD
ncbi:MAG: AAA family ATPase, partial [Candidatus Nanohaloarchaea archaeon]